jgi:hypothetical protein
MVRLTLPWAKSKGWASEQIQSGASTPRSATHFDQASFSSTDLEPMLSAIQLKVVARPTDCVL